MFYITYKGKRFYSYTLNDALSETCLFQFLTMLIFRLSLSRTYFIENLRVKFFRLFFLEQINFT